MDKENDSRRTCNSKHSRNFGYHRKWNADLGEKAERYITVTESEFLSIRPAKKNQNELKEVNDGR